jgi:hypothetical protein
MAAFEAMCGGYLGISAHWHLFWYFFRFTYLKDGSRVVSGTALGVPLNNREIPA